MQRMARCWRVTKSINESEIKSYNSILFSRKSNVWIMFHKLGQSQSIKNNIFFFMDSRDWKCSLLSVLWQFSIFSIQIIDLREKQRTIAIIQWAWYNVCYLSRVEEMIILSYYPRKDYRTIIYHICFWGRVVATRTIESLCAFKNFYYSRLLALRTPFP